MTTSGAIDGLLTAGQIITMAGELLGEVSEGAVALPAFQADLAMRHLNSMLKSMQVDGCHLWREFEDTATFAIATATVTLAPRVLDVMEARVIQTDLTQRPLARWERGEYVSIPNKTSAGVPTAYTLTQSVAGSTTGLPVITMTVWPVPSVSTDVIYTAARVIEDVTALSQTLDLPQHWVEAITYKLADRLSAVLGLSGTPSAQDVKQRAESLYQLMRNTDRPASYFLLPGR